MSAPVLILIVASGPEKGQVYELLENKPVVLGREGEPFSFDDRRCSRQHARIWHEDDTWYIEDCQSSHGTFVNRKRIEGKTTLSDGDRVQMGKTVFVLARMSLERAERLALLGDAPTHPRQRDTLPAAPARRHPYAMAVAGVAAAAIVVGVNLYTHMDAVERNAQLRHDMASLQGAAIMPDTRLAHSGAPGDAVGSAAGGSGGGLDSAKLDALLALAERGGGDVRGLAMIQEIHEAVSRRSAGSQTLMDALLAQAQHQREHTTALRELRDQMAQGQQQLRPALVQLSNAAQQLATSNTQAMSELREHLDGRLAQVVQQARISPELTEAMNQLRTELGQRPTASQLLEPMQQAIARSEGQTRAFLEQSFKQVQDQAQRETALAELRQVLGEQLPEAVARELRQVLTERTGETERLLTQVLTKLENQPTLQPLAAELREWRAAEARQAEEWQSLLAMAAAAPTAFESELAELRRMVEQQPERTEARLAALLDAHTTAGDRAAVLAAIDQLREQMPADSSETLRELLAALEAQPARALALNDEQMQAMLGVIQSRVSVGLDALQTAVRQQVTESMIETQLAAIEAARRELARHRFDTEADRNAFVSSLEAMEASVDDLDLAQVRRGAASTHATAPLAAPVPSAPRLTATELAYKTAFETGEPTTIGGGVRNPVTGEVSEGRVIDPQAAKAAGLMTWRDWYLMEDYTERARLQRQALLHAREGSEPIVRLPMRRPMLPELDAEMHASPEPIDEGG